MAIRAIVHIRDVSVIGPNQIQPEILVTLTSDPALQLSHAEIVDANAANLANIVPGLKNQVINVVQNRFGQTIVGNEIALFNAPQ